MCLGQFDENNCVEITPLSKLDKQFDKFLSVEGLGVQCSLKCGGCGFISWRCSSICGSSSSTRTRLELLSSLQTGTGRKSKGGEKDRRRLYFMKGKKYQHINVDLMLS